MTQELTTTTASGSLLEQFRTNPLFIVVESYLDTVKTAKGKSPTQIQKEQFILECIANRLNPIKKQAYLMGYDNKDGGANWSTIISISGLTTIASRTGEFAGVDQPRFNYNGQDLDSCSVTVYRLVKGQPRPFTGNAYYSERVQTTDEWKNGHKTGRVIPTKQWASQPKTMLEKCARAAALRSAFPEELGSFYDEAEMPPVSVTITENKTPEINYITDPQLKKLLKEILPALSEINKVSIEDLQAKICATWKVGSLTELSIEQATKTISSALEKIEQIKSEKEEIKDELLADSIPPTNV